MTNTTINMVQDLILCEIHLDQDLSILTVIILQLSRENQISSFNCCNTSSITLLDCTRTTTGGTYGTATTTTTSSTNTSSTSLSAVTVYA